MPFPAGAQTVVLSGHVELTDGQAQREPIVLTPSPPEIVSTTYNDIVDNGPITVVPDRGTGNWSVRLLATDAATYVPSGWTYLVSRGDRAPYSISLPAAAPAVDLSDLTPVSADPGTYDLLVPLADLGGASVLNVGTIAGTVAAGDDTRIVNAYQQAAATALTGRVGVLEARSPAAAYKAADDPRFSTVVPADDGQLLFAAAANSAYMFESMLLVEGDPAADLMLTFTAPAGAVGGWTPDGVTLSTSDGTGSVRLTKLAFGATASMGITAAGVFVLPQGVVVTGATAGNVRLQWSQAVTSVTPTTLRAGSCLRVTKLG